MIRVTVKDPQQTVSFLTGRDTLLRLVAACSSKPANLGELLVAGEVYQKGITSEVMAQLMEFDKALRRRGSDFLQEAFDDASGNDASLPAAFQVVGDRSERAALTPREGGLVVIDLVERTIRTSQPEMVAPSGEVLVKVGERTTDQAITYILPKEWSIESL